MKITDKNVSFILFFIPFLFIHGFAGRGPHGQRMRPSECSDTLLTKTAELGPDGSTISSRDSILRKITDPAIEKRVAGIGAPELSSDSALSCRDTLKSDISNFRASVYNASVIDYQGLMMPDGVVPLAGVKRFRGTVVPGGDTIHFRVPVYGDISLENLEFSGIVYKEPEITIETKDFENPYSFASGLWTIISSAGGLVTLGFASEPLLDAASDRTETALMIACGYIIAGVGQYFGVDKVVRHFRWKNQFENRLSLHLEGNR
ncbi:MAG TPA: hypothetical protein VHO70_13355 [Chitinispirillaceae bacterium]|nr:hypothetical protein [Chitinispirillaceae bacterium]